LKTEQVKRYIILEEEEVVVMVMVMVLVVVVVVVVIFSLTHCLYKKKVWVPVLYFEEEATPHGYPKPPDKVMYHCFGT
jgi:hypothetical protein